MILHLQIYLVSLIEIGSMVPDIVADKEIWSIKKGQAHAFIHKYKFQNLEQAILLLNFNYTERIQK